MPTGPPPPRRSPPSASSPTSSKDPLGRGAPGIMIRVGTDDPILHSTVLGFFNQKAALNKLSKLLGPSRRCCGQEPPPRAGGGGALLICGLSFRACANPQGAVDLSGWNARNLVVHVQERHETTKSEQEEKERTRRQRWGRTSWQRDKALGVKRRRGCGPAARNGWRGTRASFAERLPCAAWHWAANVGCSHRPPSQKATSSPPRLSLPSFVLPAPRCDVALHLLLLLHRLMMTWKMSRYSNLNLHRLTRVTRPWRTCSIR